MKRPLASVMTTTAIGALALAACGGSGTTKATSAASSTSTVAVADTSRVQIGTTHTSLGTVLVAGPKRLTVYMFEADKGGTSACSGACAQLWPPVITSGEPATEGGAIASKLSTITRSDGSKQVTYDGHPLYYFVKDSATGETHGQGVDGFGGHWYVLAPDGNAILGTGSRPHASSKPTPAASSSARANESPPPEETPAPRATHEERPREERPAEERPAEEKPAEERPAPEQAAPMPEGDEGIPQGNGGDHDGDNNGGPSDGDGNI
jgi:predicted lipoprotein with Yx(FWY)xxD motif